MKTPIKAIFITVFTLVLATSIAVLAETFDETIVIKKAGTSPNIELHEGVGNDTYANLIWYGSDGNINVLQHAHEIKGTTGAVHKHFSTPFSCGTNPADHTNCGRIDTDIDNDFPTSKFTKLNLHIKEGKLFLNSPDGNTWRLSVDNNGALQIVDTNP